MRLLPHHSTTWHSPDFHAIFNAIPAAYLLLSRDLEILAVSDAYLRISGRQREELVGRRLDCETERRRPIACAGKDRRLLVSARRVLRSGKPHQCMLRRRHYEENGASRDAGKRSIWCLTESPLRDGNNTAYVLHQAKEIDADGRGLRRISRWERRLLEMQENDRHRIARELHDQTSQGLAALMLGLESLKQQPQQLTEIEHLQELVEQLGNEVHRLTWDLRPAPIEQLGFRPALERLVEELLLCSRCQIYFYSDLAADVRFDPQVETVCYRIVQEGLTNIVRHSQASVAGVVVSRHEGGLNLIIEDDGAGFDAATPRLDPDQRDHLGLRGMRERLALLGGSLVVESAFGHGTCLYIRIPVGEL